VTQTGAILNGENKNILDDAPLLEKNKEYELFLDEFGNDTFVPVGGRLGVAEIIKGELEFTNKDKGVNYRLYWDEPRLCPIAV
jgi:hypothetical protein